MKYSGKSWVIMGSLCAVLLAPAAALAAGRQEVSSGALFFIPDDKNGLFSNGVGGEVQYRYWLNDDWAVALSVGALRLNVKEDDSLINGSAGRVDILPVGGSILYDFIDYAPFRVLLEGGVRYCFINSKATMVDVIGRRLDLEIANGFTLLVGLDAEYALTKRVSVFGDARYQWDPQGESINTIYGPQRDNQLTSLLFRLGASVNF
ncbi:MAG: outer membrane beta-barrel protein [Kiritimatiellaeota bacterium]|nr:outer membrane beta-barrel protein [Kiritimatiellota bacterium]